jgi:hypothetical protein
MSGPRFVTAWVDGSFRAAIMFEGRDLVRFVIQTPKVVVRRQAKDEIRVEDAGPVDKAAAKFRGSARRNGATKEARRLLAGVGR